MNDSSLPMSRAITSPLVVVDDFLPADVALSMRADIEAHFGTPQQHRAETHEVWNYWYVPGAYTYLKTSPEKVIEQTKVRSFVDRLQRWSISMLGLGHVTWPFLSLYVDGCSQILHNDSLNGRFGFVYSLTKQDRRTIGGETRVVSEGDPFRQNLQKSMTLDGFSNAVEPAFNRLVIFDDRMIHGVERVAGSMDPLEGRFVLHGHISDQGPIVAGALSDEALQGPIRGAVGQFIGENPERAAAFHGLISVWFLIGPDGTVSELRVLLDRVTHLQNQDAGQWPALRERYLAALTRIGAPRAEGYTTVILPMIFPGLSA
jgi:hypothetical protein